MSRKLKIHARVTKEIEISMEQAERLVNNMCDCTENADIKDILEKFTDGIDHGNYEPGYIPQPWLEADLEALKDIEPELYDYLKNNRGYGGDIDL